MVTHGRAPTLWDDDEPTWSVAEMGTAVGNALRRAFPDEVWVRGVIRDLSRGRSGMAWFDLVEPALGGDHSRPPLAKMPVVLFGSARLRVNARLRDAGAAVRMADGTEVRIRGRVGFWGQGGRLQVQMSDIDPAFTLGRLAADRDRLLRLLDAEGLLTRQQALPRPTVPLRLGVVTSGGSAAETDVLDELRRSGLGFRVARADARVQGPSAPQSVARALRRAAAHGVDLVLLVRGGGATSDLAAFDSEVIARAVAGLDTVVITGIGHDVDRSVADEVAHAAYKTPTACARAVVEDVVAFDQRLGACWADVALAARRQARRETERLRACGRQVALGTRHGVAAADRSLAATGVRLRRSSTAALSRTTTTLERATGRVEAGARAHLRGHDQALDAGRDRLVARAPRTLTGAERELARIAGQVRALDPARTLARGWSITRRADGTLVRSPHDVSPGDGLRTTVAGGDVHSVATPAPGRTGHDVPADDDEDDQE